MKWLVCGSRKLGDLASLKSREDPEWEEREKQYNFIMRELDKLSIQRSKHYNPDDNWLPADIEIINGKARGVDAVSTDWAIVNWCRFKEYPADWNKHGRAAGPIRNAQMLKEEKPDLVIAFPLPDSIGTKDMIKQAKKAGVEVIEIHYKLEKLCDHEWKDESILYKGNFRMTATVCNKCGITYNSWSKERDGSKDE